MLVSFIKSDNNKSSFSFLAMFLVSPWSSQIHNHRNYSSSKNNSNHYTTLIETACIIALYKFNKLLLLIKQSSFFTTYSLPPVFSVFIYQ